MPSCRQKKKRKLIFVWIFVDGRVQDAAIPVETTVQNCPVVVKFSIWFVYFDNDNPTVLVNFQLKLPHSNSFTGSLPTESNCLSDKIASAVLQNWSDILQISPHQKPITLHNLTRRQILNHPWRLNTAQRRRLVPNELPEFKRVLRYNFVRLCASTFDSPSL